MTAERMSWSSLSQQGRDAADQAWYRLGVSRFDLGILRNQGPTTGPIADVADALRVIIEEPGRALLRELDADFTPEEEQRILASAARHLQYDIVSSLNQAVSDEWAAANTEILPFDPPAAGQWIRERWLPTSRGRGKPRLTPEWSGAWHVFSGDLMPGDSRTGDLSGRTTCGRSISLRSVRLFDGTLSRDHVAVDGQPGVDVCRSCARNTR